MWFWTSIAAAEEPGWLACRPHLAALSQDDLAARDLRLARTSDPPAPTSSFGARLVATADGWTLDGVPVTELPPLSEVVVLIAADLPVDEVARLLDPLRASDATVWIARWSTQPFPDGAEDPAARPTWAADLDRCAAGRRLLRETRCDGGSARWDRAVATCGAPLPAGPIGIPVAHPVALEPLDHEPAEPYWADGGQHWGTVPPGQSWVVVGPRALLEVKRRVDPEYPESAQWLGDQVCVATVAVQATGVPTSVTVDGCPAPFRSATTAALMKWRWYPPTRGTETVAVEADVRVRFHLGVDPP